MEEAFPVVVSLHAHMLGSSETKVASFLKKAGPRLSALPANTWVPEDAKGRQGALEDYSAAVLAGLKPALAALRDGAWRPHDVNAPTRFPEAPVIGSSVWDLVVAPGRDAPTHSPV